jgi:hypothetical protein
MRAVPLEPPLAAPDPPLQRPGHVREVQRHGPGDGVGRHAEHHQAGREHRQGPADRVATHVAEEDPGTNRVPRQERAGPCRERKARGDTEPILPPARKARVGHTADQCVGAGDAVDAVHEVEGVHEADQPQRNCRDGEHKGESGQPDRHDKHAGHRGCPGRLQRQPRQRRQAAQVIEQPEQAEEPNRGRERGSYVSGTRRDQHGRDKSDGDRRTTPARRRH